MYPNRSELLWFRTWFGNLGRIVAFSLSSARVSVLPDSGKVSNSMEIVLFYYSISALGSIYHTLLDCLVWGRMELAELFPLHSKIPSGLKLEVRLSSEQGAV